jgi:hypothetical protein
MPYSLLLAGALFCALSAYFLTRPEAHIYSPETGRIYEWSEHGIIRYLTFYEHVSLITLASICAASIIAGAICSLLRDRD